MKFIHRFSTFLLVALLAGCASTGNRSDDERFLGKREQFTLLAKARPLSEFGFSPSYRYGKDLPFFGAAVLEPNQTASMPFLSANMPVVELQGKSAGTKLTVLLDTSSNASWMQYSCAKENDLAFLEYTDQPIPYLGRSGTAGADAYAGVVPLLHMDQLTLSNAFFYIRMARGTMMPEVYSRSAPRVDAVLGYDNLRQFQNIQFNLREGTVSFSSSTPYTPDENRLIGSADISTVCSDALAVDGVFYDESAPVILDFAGDYSFACANAREAVTKQVELGEIFFVNVPTQGLVAREKYARAGRGMLEKYIVTVCPRKGVVYFERP